MTVDSSVAVLVFIGLTAMVWLVSWLVVRSMDKDPNE